MTFFRELFATVDAALAAQYAGMLGEVIDYVGVVFRSLAIILVIGIGVSLLFGWMTRESKEILKSVLVVVVVMILSSSAAQYNEFLGDFLRGLPDDLVGLVSTDGSDSEGVGVALDEYGAELLEAITNLWKNASGVGEMAAVAVFAVLFLVVWAVMSVVAAFGILMAKIALSVLVAAGPFVLITLMFPPLKDFFSKWLTYCISFSFLAMLIGGIIAVSEGITMAYLSAFNDPSIKVDFVVFAGPLVILIGLYRLFEAAPGMASSIAGGIGIASGGSSLASYVSAAARPARAAASMGYQRTVGEQLQARRNVRVHQHTSNERARIRERDAAREAKKQPKPQPI